MRPAGSRKTAERNLADIGELLRRLDWILISPELAFRSYAVLPDRVSDHCAVVAEIALR